MQRRTTDTKYPCQMYFEKKKLTIGLYKNKGCGKILNLE